MKHWHRCKRWEDRGLACPFAADKEHDEIEGPERDFEDDTVPFPKVPLPAKRKSPTKVRTRPIEDMVSEILDAQEAIRGGEPGLPPPPDLPPLIPPPRGVPPPAPAPARVPVRVPATAPVKVPATVASFAIEEAFAKARVADPFPSPVPTAVPFQQRRPRLAPAEVAARGEVATAEVMSEGIARSRRALEARAKGNRLHKAAKATAIAAGTGAAVIAAKRFQSRPRGGGGFFFNQAAQMRRLMALPAR